VELLSGGKLTSSSALEFPNAPPPSGSAGSVTIQGLAGPSSSAQTLSIDGPNSGIFTDTQGTGIGGDIHVATSQSATLSNGATISASSSGTGDAGNISINAGQLLNMSDSSIKTQSTQAAGGDIDIQAIQGVQMTSSTISTSVLGGSGGGGNITIDPQYVILQNSQILAQAFQGPGGNIFITTNLLLQDANSVISASSQFGQQGTITIQAPIDPAGGKIIPLSQKPLIATALLSQRCAALAGGEYSSFTVAGRDSLPAEPASWLSSPLALTTLANGTALRASSERERPAARGEGGTPILSLRQIAPPGFLTQAFAANSSAGCAS